jgi:transcriptional regulator with XRE-family HTH domain
MARQRERQLEVAARIRELRGARPQPVVAEAIDVRLRTYQHWEHGDGISWENLQKLAAYFGVSENYLLYGEEQAHGPEGQLDRIEAKVEAALELLTELQIAVAAPPMRKRGRGGEAAAGGSRR